MSDTPVYLVEKLTVLDLVGNDAGQILHNLTTNDVQALDVGQACETFITDVRGKTLHHLMTIRTENGFRLVGPGGESAPQDPDESGVSLSYSTRLAQHCDRYTIREDAEPKIQDDDWVALVSSPDVAPDERPNPSAFPLDWYDCAWLGPESAFALIPSNEVELLKDQLGVPIGDEIQFHLLRTLAGFPWYGVDLNEKNLPQEADRDAAAINFHKGCYLGQETVARLDALGQVQKKLVQWIIRGGNAKADDLLQHDQKSVGRLTSVAELDGSSTNAIGKLTSLVGNDVSAIAIGMARRSHFDPGSVATGGSSSNPSNSDSPNALASEYQAEVIQPHA